MKQETRSIERDDFPLTKGEHKGVTPSLATGSTREPRRGAVLLLVLVVIPVMALGGYAFTHWMRAEAKASQASRRQAQARWLAESGVDFVRGLLADPENLISGQLDLENNPSLFAGVAILQDVDGAAGMVTLMSPLDETGSNQIRYGLVNESRKIPLHNNGLGMTRDSLMGLPNMTEAIADAILDWIDADDEPRELGAESQYYLSLSPPYRPRNGAPKTIGELLLVKGVTPALLYGEDANLDGVLNPNENDGDASWPSDNADGTLDRGWYPYFTIYSASANVSSTGEPKINLNGDAEEVAKQLADLFGEDIAGFYTLYRQQKSQLTSISELIDATVTPPNQNSGQGENSGQGLGGTQSGDVVAAPASGPRSTQAAPTSSRDSSSGGASQSGGQGATSVQVRSVAGPSGQTAGQGQSQGNQPQEPIKSPWTSENASEYLDRALDLLSVSDDASSQGKIDPTLAPAAVLRSLPNVDEALSLQMQAAGSQRSSREVSFGWLFTSGVLTLEQFRNLEQHLTSTNRVWRFESVGFFEGGGPVARIEAVLDASDGIPEIRERRDLSGLGNGYANEDLQP